MVIIQHVLINEEVLSEQFACNLAACKGACCWEGDYGAPLEASELDTLEQIYDAVKPFLRSEGIEVIEREGKYTYFKEAKAFGTPLLQDGACAYLTFNKDGIAMCGIEKAYRAGATDYRKPISCHLYPVRVEEQTQSGFESLRYDRWDICSAACDKGKANKISVFEFAREALIRKYGEAFYEELEAASAYLDY